MSARFTAPRGTNDFSGPRARRMLAVLDTARRAAERFGYDPVDTPIFEASEVFARSIGEDTDIVSKEMYTFQDRKGRSLTLRPEGTAGVVRALIEGNLVTSGPARLYYWGPMFRYERPQAGRYRQFFQFGVEAFGEAGATADAQTIHLLREIGRGLGLSDLSVVINSVGCPGCRRDYGARLVQTLRPRASDLCPDCLGRLERNPLRILDCKVVRCQEAHVGIPSILDALCAPCRAHHDALLGHLSDLAIPYTQDPRLVRGLDYYTRTAFEVRIPGHEGAQNALGGGGRYDLLVEHLGGRPTPAIGFAIGVERILALLEQVGIDPIPLGAPRVYIASVGVRARARALVLASALRSEGVACTLDGSDGGFGRQLRSAHREGATLALIMGDDEVGRDTVALKNMAAGTQEETPLGTIVEAIQARLAVLGAAARGEGTHA